jgi:hypothetical protein
MKMADGGWRPAYDAQIVSDTSTGLIAAVGVETSGADMGRLRPMNDALSKWILRGKQARSTSVWAAYAARSASPPPQAAWSRPRTSFS